MKFKDLLHNIEEIKADFRVGKESRFTQRLTGVQPGGSGADYHYRNPTEFYKGIERARHYERNDAIVGQGLRRLVANIIQDGFTCDFSTGDPGLDAEWKARQDEWASDPNQCDSEGELDFVQQEKLTFLTVLRDGDILSLMRSDGALQSVEAHRIRTPYNTKKNTVHGVQMEEGSAKRLGYWITNEDLDPMKGHNQSLPMTRASAREDGVNKSALHLYMPSRFTQRRGMTVLAPCTDMIGMHDDLQFTTLVKQQMSSVLGIVRNRGPNWTPGGDKVYGERTEDTAAGYTRQIEGMEAGIEVASDIDETISMFGSNIPSSEFFQHTGLILTFIGINLDLPLCVLLLDPTKTNFSGWRGAIDQARMRFKQMQSWFIGAYHNPITNWQIRRWMKEDPIARAIATRRVKTKPFSFKWHPPGFPYVDPQTDITTDVMAFASSQNSMRRIQSARGRDWGDVSTEIVDDKVLLIDKAMEAADMLNAKYPGSDVNWREIASIPMPSQVTMSLAPNIAGEQPADASKGAEIAATN